MHISSSYAKILGQKLFRAWEFPRSGSKAEDGENYAKILGEKLFHTREIPRRGSKAEDGGKRGERERKKD